MVSDRDEHETLPAAVTADDAPPSLPADAPSDRAEVPGSDPVGGDADAGGATGTIDGTGDQEVAGPTNATAGGDADTEGNISDDVHAATVDPGPEVTEVEVGSAVDVTPPVAETTPPEVPTSEPPTGEPEVTAAQVAPGEVPTTLIPTTPIATTPIETTPIETTPAAPDPLPAADSPADETPAPEPPGEEPTLAAEATTAEEPTLVGATDTTEEPTLVGAADTAEADTADAAIAEAENTAEEPAPPAEAATAEATAVPASTSEATDPEAVGFDGRTPVPVDAGTETGEPVDDTGEDAPAKPRSRGKAVAVLTILSLLVVGVGVGGFLWSRRSSDHVATSPQAAQINTSPTLPDDAFVTFKDSEAGISIRYPRGWTRSQAPVREIRLIASDGKQFSVLIRVSHTQEATTPANLANIKSVTDGLVGGGVQVLKQDPISLNDMIGYRYIYTYPDPKSGLTTAHLHYFLFQGHKMNSIVLEAVPTQGFDRIQGVFEQMLESFHSDPEP